MDDVKTPVPVPAATSYTPPVVTDAGTVGEVTLGNKTFDTDDDTQYKTDPND